MAIGVVFNALSDSNDAPFKKALLESGLAQDLDMTVNDDAAQTFISIDAKNIQDGKDAEVIETIKRVAGKTIEAVELDKRLCKHAVTVGQIRLFEHAHRTLLRVDILS